MSDSNILELIVKKLDQVLLEITSMKKGHKDTQGRLEDHERRIAAIESKLKNNE